VPRSLSGRFTIVCAILRQLHLTISLSLSIYLSYIQQYLPFPKSTVTEPFDVFFVDQLSASVPLLRWWLGTRVVFYCHFPDLLLSPGRLGHSSTAPNFLRRIYRLPIDRLEEFTTGKERDSSEYIPLIGCFCLQGEADKVLVNSEFTSRIFSETFKSLPRPTVVYPGIDLKQYQESSVATGTSDQAAEVEVLRSCVECHSFKNKWNLYIYGLADRDVPTLLSINRFEQKKQLTLALRAFGALVRGRRRDDSSTIRLVIAGGYDPRLSDNVVTLVALQELATSLGLSHYTYSSTPNTHPGGGPKISSSPPPPDTQVIFVTNLSQVQKTHLLRSGSTKTLLYTPENEHLGIVPLEAMACGLPVLACNSGGPVETVLDNGLPSSSPSSSTSAAAIGTGLLRRPDPEEWADAIDSLLSLSPESRKLVAQAGRKRVQETFSLESMSRGLEKALKGAVTAGGKSDRLSVWQEDSFLLVVAAAFLFLVIFGVGLYSALVS
jgi:alpha-1,3/alpha-1,6-mannosyltransferase